VLDGIIRTAARHSYEATREYSYARGWLRGDEAMWERSCAGTITQRMTHAGMGFVSGLVIGSGSVYKEGHPEPEILSFDLLGFPLRWVHVWFDIV